jgi:hypothetical protein
MLICMLLAAVLLVPQSSADTPAARPTMISDVGQWRSTNSERGSRVTTYDVYAFEGYIVSGDMPVADFRAVVNVVTQRLERGERILRVINRKVTDSSWSPQSGDMIDVETCTDCVDPTRPIDRGRLFMFSRGESGVQLAGVGGWIS